MKMPFGTDRVGSFLTSGLALVLCMLTALPSFADAVSEGLALGVPVTRVPGVALIQFDGIHVHRIQLPRKSDTKAVQILAEVEKRTGIQIQLDKAAPMGFGLYRIRQVSNGAGDKVPTEDETAHMILRLAEDPAIKKIAQDTWHRPLLVPNDSYYSDMWHLDIIGAAAAWNMTTGDSSQRIGVIDTGLIRNHEDLQSKDAYGYDFISDSSVAQDSSGRDDDYTDEGDGGFCPGFGNMPDSWHGTHVSGTILAATNNQKGIAGVNWAAQLVTVRALGRCGGDSFDIMSGALWLTGYPIDNIPTLPAEHRVSVMNLSLGSQASCSSFEQEAISTINTRGAVFVAATGNDGGGVGSPANCTGVISVAAMGPDGNLASYSSFGPEVEIVAPGGDGMYVEDGIASASGPGHNDYEYQQGTSMAAPHVSGAISLAQAIDPTLTGYQEVSNILNQGLSCGNCNNVPALMLDLILEEVDPTNSSGGSSSGPEDDSYEENDAFDSAATIHCGDTLDLFAASLDYDFYSFESVGGTPIEVSISADHGADLDLYWVKGMSFPQDTLSSSESPTGDESLTFTSTGETMVILVNPWFNEQTNDYNSDSYQLTLDCEPIEDSSSGVPGGGSPQLPDPATAADDALEENDSVDMAQRVSCQESVDFVLQDDDWYVVRLDDNTMLSVTTEGTHAPVAIELFRADDPDTILADSAGLGNRQLATAEGLKLGDYLIRAKFKEQDTFYSMTVVCETTPMVDETGCSHLGLTSETQKPAGGTLMGIVLFTLLAWRRRQ